MHIFHEWRLARVTEHGNFYQECVKCYKRKFRENRYNDPEECDDQWIKTGIWSKPPRPIMDAVYERLHWHQSDTTGCYADVPLCPHCGDSHKSVMLYENGVGELYYPEPRQFEKVRMPCGYYCKLLTYAEYYFGTN